MVLKCFDIKEKYKPSKRSDFTDLFSQKDERYGEVYMISREHNGKMVPVAVNDETHEEHHELALRCITSIMS